VSVDRVREICLALPEAVERPFGVLRDSYRMIAPKRLAALV
jgi:hypothetical protein